MVRQIETGFGVGDSVYRAGTRTERQRLPCPDCGDSRRVQLVTRQETLDAECPRCQRAFGNRDLEIKVHVPEVRPLTVGSVQVDTYKDEPVGYMCEETGVGSGQVHPESRLFATYGEAEALATQLADEANTDRPESEQREVDRRVALSVYPMTMSLTEPWRRYAGELEDHIEDTRARVRTVLSRMRVNRLEYWADEIEIIVREDKRHDD